MQEIIVTLILAGAIVIIWKHLTARAPSAAARKPGENVAGMVAESGCSACGTCPKHRPSGCENAIPVKTAPSSSPLKAGKSH